MDELSSLFHGFAVVMTPMNLLLMFIGIVLGVLIGVLPGLGGANGIAILLPLTFSMNPTSAIIMLSCIYWGALFGGAITSILFNIPGEPWSVATTFDGYPLAQKGKAGQALMPTANKDLEKLGVKVIAAHASGNSHFFDPNYFGELIKLMDEFPQMYADTSALNSPIRSGSSRGKPSSSANCRIPGISVAWVNAVTHSPLCTAFCNPEIPGPV